MKEIGKFILLVSLLIQTPTLVIADTDTANSTPPATKSKGKRISKPSKAQKAMVAKRFRISGHCSIIASPMNPIEGSCVSVPLSLRDESQKEIAIVRTSNKGEFQFVVEESGKFTVTPNSRFYLLVSPTAAFAPGKPIELMIQQKN